MPDLTALTGTQLIRLLLRDGWEEHRRSNHGVALKKKFGGRTRTAIIPTHRRSLNTDTLNRILGPLQTNLGRHGLQRLLDKRK